MTSQQEYNYYDARTKPTCEYQLHYAWTRIPAPSILKAQPGGTDDNAVHTIIIIIFCLLRPLA